jgi:hypothetical protein
MTYPDDINFYRDKVLALITTDVVSSVHEKYPGVTGQILIYILCLEVAMQGFQLLHCEVENLHSIIAKQTNALAALEVPCENNAATMSREGDSDLEAALDLKYQDDVDL